MTLARTSAKRVSPGLGVFISRFAQYSADRRVGREIDSLDHRSRIVLLGRIRRGGSRSYVGRIVADHMRQDHRIDRCRSGSEREFATEPKTRRNSVLTVSSLTPAMRRRKPR
jgi:hypothetical protein